MRLTGLATGMDTDTMIKQMMKPFTMKVDKMKQDRQMVAWKQELYREILADTAAIKNTFFDVLKPATNMLSKNSYEGFDVTATNSDPTKSAGVSATASVGATVGNYTVNVTQLASGAKVESVNEVKTTENGQINKYTTTLGSLGVSNGTLKLNYKDANGVEKKDISINVSSGDTVSQLIDKINQETSGAVKLNFSELTNKFSIESLKTGSEASLEVTAETTNILTNLKLNAAASVGKNAEFTITPPGGPESELVIRPSNTFSIDGVNYTLTKADTVNNITVTGNSQKTYDKIKGFIDKYNELVDKINQKTDEKKQYKFLPLTDEQRAAMKEDEIKQWETKAKVGLLKGDSNLESMVNEMRSAFFQGVEGAGISLSEIGLSTSPDTSKKGKIIIDETKLKAAIETRGEQVANLFAKSSKISYSPDNTTSQKNDRNKEQGIFQRINDILQDYTRTSRNNNGKKGVLLEKVGIKGDLSEFKSLMSQDIINKDAKINEMIKSLSVRENKFYLQFSKLEVAMNKLNSQSSWLTQQLGGGQ